MRRKIARQLPDGPPAGRDRRGRRRRRQHAGDEQVVVAEHRAPRDAQTRARRPGAARRRAFRDGAAGRGRAGSTAGRGSPPPGRRDSPGRRSRARRWRRRGRASAQSSSLACALSIRSPPCTTASGPSRSTARRMPARTWTVSVSWGRKVERNGGPSRARNGALAGDWASSTWASVTWARVARTPRRGLARPSSVRASNDSPAPTASTPDPSGSIHVERSVDPSADGARPPWSPAQASSTRPYADLTMAIRLAPASRSASPARPSPAGAARPGGSSRSAWSAANRRSRRSAGTCTAP